MGRGGVGDRGFVCDEHPSTDVSGLFRMPF